MGLATASNDENTGNMDGPLANFAHTRDSLRDVQAQVRAFVASVEAMFQAARGMAFLYAPLAGETAKQVKLSLCREAVQEATVRGLKEYLEAPLRAALDFCDYVDGLVKKRAALLLDYDHHKRKHDATQAKGAKRSQAEVEEEVRHRAAKLAASTNSLKDCNSELEAQMAALQKVEPQLKSSLYKGLAACQIFLCQASLAAFDPAVAEGSEMQDYIGSLQRAASLLEQNKPLPPPGDHVTYLQNALAAAAVEAGRGAAAGEVYGRPLADFDDVPPVVLECMGFLDAHGLYVPGLFRVPGNKETVGELKHRFDSGEHVEFNETIHNVHDVATLLKMFFRELPEPVVPPDCYHALLEAGTRPADAFVGSVQRALAGFPPINATCLRLLFAFLFRVNLCAADNKMSAENLGIVFAPNLLRAPNSTEISVVDLQSCINLVKRVIEVAPEVFPDLWQGYPASAGG
ncbi:unnamed protein product [Phaeothamnion confervicola]